MFFEGEGWLLRHLHGTGRWLRDICVCVEAAEEVEGIVGVIGLRQLVMILGLIHISSLAWTEFLFFGGGFLSTKDRSTESLDFSEK